MGLNKLDYELIEKAKNIIDKNFDDIKWNHTVGAAVRCKSGKIYLGVNCDGIHGSCAEYIAIGAAITAGEREFDSIVAVYGKKNDYKILMPCGNCRQMLIEYSPEIRVVISNKTSVGIRELLPNPCV